MAGLYTIAPINTEADHQIKLIDLSVAGADFASWHTFELRWSRWDEASPDVRGLESLTLRLDAPVEGRTYVLPGSGIQASYEMATPAKGEGARAADLEGSVRVAKRTSEGALLEIDLAARMARIDVRGGFRESVRGTWWLPAR